MKKLMLFALAGLFCGTADAQKVKSTSHEIITTTVVEQVKPVEKKKTRYVRYGLDILTFHGEDWKSDPRVGYEFLYGMQRRMKNNFYYNFEIGLGSRGYKSSYEKLIAHNIKMTPVAFGYKHTFDNGLALDGHLGFGMSVDYSGRVVPKGDDSFSIWENVNAAYIPLDVYFKLGVGVWYKNFNFDLSFHPGLVPAMVFDDYNDDDIFIKANVVSLGFSVAF